MKARVILRDLGYEAYLKIFLLNCMRLPDFYFETKKSNIAYSKKSFNRLCHAISASSLLYEFLSFKLLKNRSHVKEGGFSNVITLLRGDGTKFFKLTPMRSVLL